MPISVSVPTVPSIPASVVVAKPVGAPAPNSSNTGVKGAQPASMKSTEGMALKRYRKVKQRVKYYELKKSLLGNLTKSEEFMYQKMQSLMKKARKLAAPELIRINMIRKSHKGRGKKRGSDLTKLMTNAVKKK